MINIIPKNKKADAGDMTMIFVFIFLIMIIGSGITLGLYAYFTQDYDFREIDSALLNKQLAQCLAQSEFNWSLPQEEIQKALFEKCSLNKKVIENYFNILIKRNDEVLFNMRGDATACALADKNPTFPRCTISEFSNFYLLTGSHQKSRSKLT